jgi:hypothetical protein
MSERLIAAAKALVKSIDFDTNGILLPTGWQGGNGGLISQETLKAADEVRRACRELEKQLDRPDQG